ncbi:MULTISPECIES: hypothetical protein [Streptosporangium]|uniref:Uncharacterized protein n=1 Tax=Streptosporangium brasiliense TaxID=47480 RepID=A0ABT9RM72_9ACTN|nr:hypothetical protein [Streptosporangium brasiliense]MDP9870393.1 hypothetical protein [Streptosporangium brasiliense]
MTDGEFPTLPILCPACFFNLKDDGYPRAHQNATDGKTCSYELSPALLDFWSDPDA